MTPAGPRDDISPLLTNNEGFAPAVTDLVTRYEPLQFENVAAIDALGFALGAAISMNSSGRAHAREQIVNVEWLCQAVAHPRVPASVRRRADR